MTSGEFTLAGTTLRARTARAVEDERLGTALDRAMSRFAGGRTTAFGYVDDPEALRVAARRVRHDILVDLPRIVGGFADRAMANGTHVHWALDADDAGRYIADVARQAGARTIVKGKSMVAEEIGLNHTLEAAGMSVVETDLGEWIIQLAGHTPSHIIAPAVHLDRHQIRDILQSQADPGEILEADPEQLAGFARVRLRQAFLDADVGITGCNFAVAESGSVVLIENEGNGRLSSTAPRIHIVVMGTERIVETFGQLGLFLELLARSATGQHTTAYTNVITGPRRPDELDGPEELHVVIVDNGRSELLGTEFAEALNCIRCGACLNVCPVYRQVGGHAYGWVYSGPIGAVLTPLLAHELPEAAELADASTLCGACMDACPVQIPLQDLLLGLRRRRAAEAAKTEKAAWRAWAQAWGRPVTYRASLKALTSGRHLSRLATRLPGLRRWSAGRDALQPARRTFTELWEKGEL